MMTPEEFEDLPNLIKKSRKAMGLGQEKVARAIDVSWGTYRNWELGRTKPSSPNLLVLVEFFGWDKGPYLRFLAGRDGELVSLAS